ncbi:MAG: Curli production assembly/transport component CsgG [Deltaproteobacteria bacterium]|nr:Curli production assembly/transport component CsgG [Deltaproteobacteria bacterium]
MERERLRLVLKELKLGTTSLVDDSTRLRLGKLVGAILMVFRGYQAIGDTVRLDVWLVEVESGRTIKAVFETARAANVPELLKATRAATAGLM